MRSVHQTSRLRKAVYIHHLVTQGFQKISTLRKQAKGLHIFNDANPLIYRANSSLYKSIAVMPRQAYALKRVAHTHIELILLAVARGLAKHTRYAAVGHFLQ